MKLVSNIRSKIVSGFRWFLASSLKIKAGVLIVLLLIGWFGIRPLFIGSSTDVVNYQTSVAEKGTLVSSVSATGTISSGSSASISSSATGVVSEVYVSNGDYVNQGQTIALLTLDQSSLQKQTAAWASYLSAQNNLNTAKSRMNGLQASLFQANQTFVNGAGTENPDTADPTYIIERAQWQQAEADYTNQQTAIAAAEAALSSAWLSYTQTAATITAPISGTITNLTIAPGTSITSSSGSDSSSGTGASSTQTVGSIKLEGGKPQAVVNLSEIDVTKIKLGQKVTLTLDAFADKTFTGRVTALDTTGSTSSGVTSYPVTITLDTSVEGMYPNMAVNATIITSIKHDVVLVPSTAVQTVNDVSTVRVMSNNQVSSVPVEIGDSNDTQTEILSGIKEGQIVVTGQTGGTGSSTSSRTSGSSGATGNSPFGVGGFGGGGTRSFTSGSGGAGAQRAIQIR